MINVRVAEVPQFRAGDNVVLTEGPYRGTPGVFLTPTLEDVHWAEIRRYDGVVQCHPLTWLRRSDPHAS